MKFRKKVVLGAIISALFVGAFSVSAAYTGTYSFDIGYQVKGTTKHGLENEATSTTATAQSYYADYTVHPDKDDYSVQIYKNLFTNYRVSSLIANGTTQTKNFGVVSSGDYTINVTKNGGNAFYIKGSGTINQ